MALALLVLPLAHVFEGGSLGRLVQPTAFLVVAGLPTLMGWLFHRGELVRSLRVAWGTGSLELGVALKAIEVVQGLRRLCLAAGTLALLSGLVHVFFNITSPTKIGPGVAGMLTAAFYLVALTELFLGPGVHSLARRGLLQSEGPSSPASAASGVFARFRGASITVASLLLGGLVVGLAHLFEGGVLKQVFLPAAIFIVLGSLLFVPVWHGRRALSAALRAGLEPTCCADDELERHRQVLLSAKAVVYGQAALGYLLGTIQCMGDFSDLGKFFVGIGFSHSVWFCALLLVETMVSPRVRRLEVEQVRRQLERHPLAVFAATRPWAVALLVIANCLAVGLTVAVLSFAPNT
ncbi:MAG TPA: hypothetical protein DIU15_16160 [Deltaproteobacteria bacterium]|nr:hypothetical protein [Deltaproteobacteria bacterium]HCP47576.1 hypothetical protein [Deltaproteobacteria bacterium]